MTGDGAGDRAPMETGRTAAGRSTGRLVLVATPIGNLGDLSQRAVEALRAADVVCCEDTRRTGRLLQHLGHRAPRLRVVDEHRERAAIAEVLEDLAAGRLVALVSDAGTPGISDPGERLVAAAVDAGFDVESIPGPTAFVTALVTSGLPTGRFVFEGFLPRRGAVRTERLREIAGERRTVLLHEAPHRLARTLGDLVDSCGGERRVVLARELTKLHEEIWRGTLDAAVARLAEVEPRGEYVLVLDGAEAPEPATDEDLLRALGEERGAGRSNRDAVTAVAEAFGVPRRRVYALATER